MTPAQPTFSSIVVRTLQVWGAQFTPLTVIALAAVYAEQMFGARLDAYYLTWTLDPMTGWTVQYAARFLFNLALFSVIAAPLIRIGLRTLGHEVSSESHLRAAGRHALPIAAIYAFMSPGDVVANLFPPMPYLAITWAWSLMMALFVCSDIARVGENGGVRASLGRSFRLLRPHIMLVLALTVLWEGLAWGAFLFQNPEFLATGALNRDPVLAWIAQPLSRTAVYLFGMLGSIVLYADLRLEGENSTARVFD